MRNTVYATRKATESHIAAIKRDDMELFDVPGDALGYETAMNIHKYLMELKMVLEADLKHFDEIDAAMEQAVK